MKKLLFLLSIFAITLSCSSDDSNDSNSLKGSYIGSDFYIGCNIDNYFTDELENFYENSKLIITDDGTGYINLLVSNSRCYKQAVAQNASITIANEISENTFMIDLIGNTFISESNIFKDGRYTISKLTNSELKLMFNLNYSQDYFVLFKLEN